MKYMASFALVLGGLCFGACSDDDDGGGLTVADRLRVGAECATDMDCPQDEQRMITQQCLTEFKGGYCGLKNCTADEECPQGSRCVSYDPGSGVANYCFRVCADKPECNFNRSEDVWSNCSSSIEFVGGKGASKACIPPSSG